MQNNPEQPPSRAARATAFLAAGFGLGYSPFASGTVGSLWGIVIVWGLYAAGTPMLVYIGICVALALLSIPLCDIAEKVYRTKDDGRIVADEFLTFPICLIGLYPYVADYWWLMPMAFCSCRFFDILKLPPARQFEKLSGGLGITLDDVAASLHSWVANVIAFHVIVRLFYA